MSNTRRRPNLLVLQPDEFRQRALAFRGEDPVITPTLDRLASEALELERCYSTFPVCSPWRASFLTGQYPESNGVTANSNSHTAPYDIRLARHSVTLSDVLSDAGYDCGYIGKWHLDSPDPADYPYLEPRRGDGKVWDAYTPPERRHGFNHWFSYGCCDMHFTPHYWTGEGGPETRLDFERWSPEVEADEAIAYLRAEDGRRNPEQPFFLMVSMNPPHMPFDEVPERYRALYAGRTAEELLTSPIALGEPPAELPEARIRQADELGRIAREVVADYFAAVSGVDEQLGRILDCLEAQGLAEDTIVLFTSDHGDMMGSHSQMYKSLWYWDSIRVPCLLRWPGRLRPGRNPVIVNTADLMPSLLGLMGLAEATPEAVEGEDLSRAWLEGDSPARSGWYYNAELGARGHIDDEGMLVVRRSPRDLEQLIYYDLASDPDQRRNAAAEHPEAVARARARLDAWLEDTGDRWLR